MLRASLAASILAGSALAQVQSPVQLAQALISLLSDDCQSTIYQLVNSSSPQYQCLQIDTLLPAILTNGSIIPPVDNYLHSICSSAPCNSTVLNETVSAITEGCSSDLEQFNVDSQYVQEIIGYYDLARDVVCLKNEEDEVLANATIPLNSTLFNSTSYDNATTTVNSTSNSTTPTNGTFCLTELATNITGYLGVNLTNSYVDTLLLGGNYSAIQAIAAIPPTALCSDCIFAAVNLINEEIPQFGDLVLEPSSNVTINDYLDQTCSAQGYNATGNGTLPDGIFDGGVNATSSSVTSSSIGPAQSTRVAATTVAGVTSGIASVATGATATVASVASAAASSVASAAPLAGRMAEKRRWLGQ